MSSGNGSSASALALAAWHVIKRISRRELAHEPRRPTWTPSDLAVNAWLRMQHERDLDWSSIEDVRRAAPRVIRRALVSRARHRNALRRRGARPDDGLPDDLAAPREPDPDLVLSLHALREELATSDPVAARCIERRYFGGYQVNEIAADEGCSIATVERALKRAREWVQSRIRREDFLDG